MSYASVSSPLLIPSSSGSKRETASRRLSLNFANCLGRIFSSAGETFTRIRGIFGSFDLRRAAGIVLKEGHHLRSLLSLPFPASLPSRPFAIKRSGLEGGFRRALPHSFKKAERQEAERKRENALATSIATRREFECGEARGRIGRLRVRGRP
jgi:hypothetical protein